MQVAARLSPDVVALHLTDLEGPDAAEHETRLRGEWSRFVQQPAMAAGLPAPRWVAAAIDGTAAFGEVGAIELALVGGAQRQQAQATLDAATTERTLLLAEFYRRNAGWRLRILGLGYDHGLATLARDYGVDVEDD